MATEVVLLRGNKVKIRLIAQILTDVQFINFVLQRRQLLNHLRNFRTTLKNRVWVNRKIGH